MAAFLIYKVGKAVCILGEIMKKLSITLCCISVLTLFAGCTSDNKESKSDDNIKVDIGDDVKVKVGDNIKVDVGDIKVN